MLHSSKLYTREYNASTYARYVEGAGGWGYRLLLSGKRARCQNKFIVWKTNTKRSKDNRKYYREEYLTVERSYGAYELGDSS